MSNLEKYNKVFIENLQVKEIDLIGLSYQSTEYWDSIGHMGLISELEDAFDIMIDMEDIVDFSSYEKGKEILLKYNVTV